MTPFVASRQYFISEIFWRIISPVKKGAISVRLSDELSAILKRIAAVYEANDVDVIRWAVKALGVYHDANGHLPPMEASERPMILHEPPRVRQELVRSEGHSKRKTGGRQRAALG